MFLAPNFVVLKLGVHPKRMRYRGTLADSENLAMVTDRMHVIIYYSLTGIRKRAFHWYRNP